ncbi:unnamed protein product, partial [marine sediment metagenome]
GAIKASGLLFYSSLIVGTFVASLCSWERLSEAYHLSSGY